MERDHNYLNGVLTWLGILFSVSLISCSDTSRGNAGNAAKDVEAREIAFANTMADRDFETFLSFPVFVIGTP
jgi:hypothetical protein